MVALVVRGLLRRPSVTFCSVHIHNKVAKKRGASISTVGDVLPDLEFMAPGNALLWGIGGLGRVDAHGCCKFDNADLGFAPRDQTAHLPVFLHLRVANLQGPNGVIRSSQAQHRRLERAATHVTCTTGFEPLATQPKSSPSQRRRWMCHLLWAKKAQHHQETSCQVALKLL